MVIKHFSKVRSVYEYADMMHVPEKRLSRATAHVLAKSPRNDFAKIIALQGETEKTGGAKITRPYNLPSCILHTVGPIVQRNLQPHHKELLASSYTSCLELAGAIEDIHSLAFVVYQPVYLASRLKSD